MEKLQTLYKINTKGTTQVFNITIDGPVYTREWGTLGGKQQTKSTTAVGKNIGKANETTPEQQAILEAKAIWTKKQKSGYSTTITSTPTVNLPMKVNEYQKHIKKIKFPAYTSPKLNGVNAEYRLINNDLKLFSRGGEEYPIPPHQHKAILSILKALNTTSLNGEMYAHGEHLQDIMAAVKKHNNLTPKLQFCVFDFPLVEGTYQERCSSMYTKRNTIKDIDLTSVPFIQVWLAHSHEEIEDQYNQVMDAGYEGLIIRNSSGLYKYNTRSLDVFKYKKTQDAEFEVIDYKLDKNKHAVYTVKSPSGATFSVKRKGSSAERLKDAQEAPSNIGKFLNISYECLSKSNIPLKPVGNYFRAVNSNGEANE